MSNLIQPPAGMRWREIVLENGACRVRYTHRFEYLVRGIEGWRPSRALDAGMLDVWVDLKANNTEPLSPAPVARDATWEAVSGLVDRVWHVAKSYERYGNLEAFPAWDGTQAVTDAILRLVRAATPRDPRIVRVLDGWYNVDPWGAHFHPTSDAAREVANARETTYTAVRLAVVTEDAETLECTDCAHHRADREAVLAACGVTEQTAETLAGEVRAAIERADRAVEVLPGWWSLHDITHNAAYQCDTQERAQSFFVNGDRCRLVSRLALVSEETKADDSDTSDTNTTNQRQYRWVGDRLEVRYPSESDWKEEYQIPVDRLHEILAMRHAPAETRGVEK